MNQNNSRFEEKLSTVTGYYEHHTGIDGAHEEIMQTHHQELQKARAEAWQEAVDLADKIELREPDGGTKQWMAFKAFRNTLRDKIKDQSELDQPTH